MLLLGIVWLWYVLMIAAEMIDEGLGYPSPVLWFKRRVLHVSRVLRASEDK